MKIFVNAMKNTVSSARTGITAKVMQARCKLAENKAEGYIDTAVFC